MDQSLIDGYNPNKLFVGYSPNDFFYSTASELNLMPNNSSCVSLKPYDTRWDISCNGINFPDASGNCISKELCKNKDYVNTLLNINKKNISSDEKYYNTKDEYNIIFMNTINLGIGCLFLLGSIFNLNT